MHPPPRPAPSSSLSPSLSVKLEHSWFAVWGSFSVSHPSCSSSYCWLAVPLLWCSFPYCHRLAPSHQWALTSNVASSEKPLLTLHHLTLYGCFHSTFITVWNYLCIRLLSCHLSPLNSTRTGSLFGLWSIRTIKQYRSRTRYNHSTSWTSSTWKPWKRYLKAAVLDCWCIFKSVLLLLLG